MIRSVKIVCLLAWSGLMFFPGLTAEAKTVRYELTVRKTPVNMSGKKTVDFALSVNGSIPAPTLEFTEGDDAEIIVKNEIGDGQELSIHWHGILLPPLEDGVSYVNTPPILAGTQRVFRFKIRQHGTYWYHSHTGLQEQKGVYGAFVIHPKKKNIEYDRDVVAVLSDWSDENADQVLKNLRKDGDYYLFKKNSVRSYAGAVKAGKLGSLFANEWMRMGGMDLSDVGYDAFLINGKRDSLLTDARPGERIRLRIINAAASSYFYVSLGNQNMRVIAADGVDVAPVDAREIMIGMAETYDVLFTVPDSNSYELRATCQDVTGYASAWIGSGAKVPAPDKPLPDYYAEMDHGSHQGHEGHAGMDHSAHTEGAVDHSKMDHSKMDHSKKVPVVETLTVEGLSSQESTAFAPGRKVMDLKLSLGGDMERYVWHINGKAIHEDRTITIREGDVIRFTFQNETMMHHPMHLHGHFFRVVGAQGDRSALKHTVDVPPHGSRTIEFLADEPGEWMLHCHNLYHMKTGMARVIKYESFTPSPEIAAIQNKDPHLHDHFYFDGMTFLGTNKAAADLRVSQMRWSLELDSEVVGTREEYDAESTLKYRRWLTNFASVYAGGRTERTHDDEGGGDAEQTGLIGISYALPLLIETDLEIDSEGVPALMLEKRLQWTSWLYSDLHAGFARGRSPDFEADLMYQTNWHWAAGLTWIDRKAGAGLMLRF